MPYGFNNDKSKFDLEDLINKIDNARSTFVDYIYPVGSIYMSVNNVSPANLFGGTWVQIKDTFLLAAGNKYAAGSIGGEAEHTLTINEIPSHSHKIYSRNWWAVSSSSESQVAGNAVSEMNQDSKSTGGGKAHNNMPPYLTVYMWKRTG